MAQPTPLQFSLKTILAITAAVALFFAAGPGLVCGICTLRIVRGVLCGWSIRVELFDAGDSSGVSLARWLSLCHVLALPQFTKRATARLGDRTCALTTSSTSGLHCQNYNDIYRLLPAGLHDRRKRQADAQLAGADPAIHRAASRSTSDTI